MRTLNMKQHNTSLSILENYRDSVWLLLLTLAPECVRPANTRDHSKARGIESGCEGASGRNPDLWVSEDGASVRCGALLGLTPELFFCQNCFY